MKPSRKILIIMMAVLVSEFFTLVEKKADTIANIYVRDEANAIVPDAMVVLYGTNTQGTPQVVAIFDTAYTNGAGLASFNYNDIYQLGQAGVAVLDIKAQKLNKIGQGIIKLNLSR